MRHRVAGRTFGRRPDQRKALLRGLAGQLIDCERITTTVAKAKELRRVVEPLVTLAKVGNLHSRRQAAEVLYRKESVQKLFGEIGPRFKDRAGGYTRIYRAGQRRGDGAETAIIEFLAPPKETKAKKAPAKAKGAVKAKATSKAATKAEKPAKKKPTTEKAKSKKKE